MPAGDLSARIAIYDHLGQPPEVAPVSAPDAATLVQRLDEAVQEILGRAGTRLPPLAVREVIENLVHAACADPVVTILDAGATLLVSDRGGGIPDKAAAMLPGFTTAGQTERRSVRGVGAGFAVAREALLNVQGTLEISDNLGGGTVVRLHAPPPHDPPLEPQTRRALQDLPERQLRALLFILELGPVGPTRLARELAVGASTAYRDLLALQALGFVSIDDRGRRLVTEMGLTYLQSVL